MRVLAIETSGSTVAVAVAEEEAVLAEVSHPADRQQVEQLHPAIATVLAEAGVSLGELDALVADVGPGLFTGIRVGVTAAKALALALGRPTVAVTSLEALRRAGLDAGWENEALVPVIDLRRGELAWELEGAIERGSPGLLAGLLAHRSKLVFVGDGALAYPGAFERPGWESAGEALASPPVASVAMTGLEALRAGHQLEPSGLAPLYLREADARINWTTRHDAGRPSGV